MPELWALAWRVLYAVCFGAAARAVVTMVLRGYRAVRSEAAADHVIGAIDARYTFSGWPFYGRGWTNLHASRFTALVRTGVARRRPPPSRPPPTPLRRIVCVGQFVGLLGFSRELMERCPVELVIADLRFNDEDAGYLAAMCDDYRAFDAATAADYDRVAAFINGSQADLVLNIGQRQYAYQILDRLAVPCIANYCAGSDLLHHAAVDIQYHGQPQADYFVRDETMFCGTTRRRFSRQFVHTITGYIDPRGLLGTTPKPWRDRLPLIVCHGSLYKFTSPAFLAVVSDWLRSEPALELVLVGRDHGQHWQTIRAHFQQHAQADRVHYRGQFSAVRDTAGEVSDDGWQSLVEQLGRARLAPNPFPLGGGSSRYEAYALGAPAPHLAVRFEPEFWGRPQPSVCEIPSMLVPGATAATVDEYRRLGLRCLRDEAFADAVAADQLAIARAITDADRWWREIVAGHDRWLARGLVRAA